MLYRKLFWGSFHNSGQICAAIKRIYIHEDVYTAVRDELVAYAKTVKIGNCLDADVGMGPVQNREQFAKVQYVFFQWETLRVMFWKPSSFY